MVHFLMGLCIESTCGSYAGNRTPIPSDGGIFARGNAEVIGFCLCNQKNAALAVRSMGGQGDQNAGKICKTLKNQ